MFSYTIQPSVLLRQAKAMRAGVYLLSAWMWSLGWLVAFQMLLRGVGDWYLFTLSAGSGPLAWLAIWVGRKGRWRAVSVALVAFIFVVTAQVQLTKSSYLMASLMNIAVLTSFAGWSLGLWMAVLVIVLCQGLLVMLVLGGIATWGALAPLMFTSFFLGGCMLYARRIHEQDSLTLAEDAAQIWEHQEHRRMLSSVVEQSPYSIEIVDLEGRILYANPTALQQMGYTQVEVLGQKSRDISLTGLDEAVCASMLQVIQSGAPWFGLVRNLTKAGDALMEQVMVAPICDEQGQTKYFVQTKLDVTERVYAQERIQRLMNYDKLTQLPNRMALERRLDELLQREQERLGKAPSNHSPHVWHGLLLLDIDRFKHFNVGNGSEWADTVLIAFAARLQELQSLHEQLWVARYTADQFVVVLEHIGSTRIQAREQALKMAVTLQDALDVLSVEQEQEPVAISVGIGITVFPFVEPGRQCDHSVRILHRALLALAESKKKGGRQIYQYAEEFAEQALQQMLLERELRTALRQGQLRMDVQPQYDKDVRVVGLEALVRWMHPERGMISPGQFIPVAEASELIMQLGEWMLEQACALLNTPQMQRNSCSVSLNISARQFMQPDFVKSIQRVLERTQAPAHRLVLEVTEGTLLADVDDAIRTMQLLQTMGVQLALDDFGTGYSSLSYLQTLPIQEVKIDQSFMQDLQPNSNAGVLVQAVLMIAKKLGLRVVAEGIEREADAILLQAWEPAILCQGYWLSHPVSMDVWLKAVDDAPAGTVVGKLSSNASHAS